MANPATEHANNVLQAAKKQLENYVRKQLENYVLSRSAFPTLKSGI